MRSAGQSQAHSWQDSHATDLERTLCRCVCVLLTRSHTAATVCATATHALFDIIAIAHVHSPSSPPSRADDSVVQNNFDGISRAGAPEWHDKLPDHHDWRATWIDNADRRHPGWVLALVDKHPKAVPDVLSAASGVMGALLLAQWRCSVSPIGLFLSSLYCQVA